MNFKPVKLIFLPDNNPMLRDGITGDWYVVRLEEIHEISTISKQTAGLAPSSATKAQSGKPGSPPTRPSQQPQPPISQRKSPILPYTPRDPILRPVKQGLGHLHRRMPAHPATRPHSASNRLPHPNKPPSSRHRRRREKAPHLRPLPRRWRQQQRLLASTAALWRRARLRHSHQLRDRPRRARRHDQVYRLEPGLQHRHHSRGRPEDTVVGFAVPASCSRVCG